MSSETYCGEYLSRLNAPEGARVKETFELFTELAPPQKGHKVLDVGCGKGPFGIYLKSRFPNLDITFTDIYRDKNEFLDQEKFFKCSMAKMPFPDETFDIVYCLHVIAHIEDRKGAVREALRILKRGGKLVVFTPNKYFVWVQRFAAFLKILPPQRFDPTAKWMFSRGSLARLLRTNVSYYRKAPNGLPIEVLREKLVAVRVK